MNNTKLTLEQFLIKKNECQRLLNNIRQLYEQESANTEYDLKQIELKYLNMYLEAQKELLSYDLSDIPFEAWQGFEIASDEAHIADFSKTNANIDFDIIEYSPYINFKGCNFRNLDKLNIVLNSKYFDDQTIKDNPSMFLSNYFSEEFKGKYHNNSLTLEDLVNFNPEQIEELKQKNVQIHLISGQINGTTRDLLGFDRALELYKYSKEEYFAVNEILGMASYVFYSSRSNIFEKIETAKVSEIKDICYSYLRNDIITKQYSILKTSDYPKLFVEENDDIFLVNANIPDEVRERYYSRKLTVEDLVEYSDVFNIPLDYFLEDNYLMREVRKVYDIGIFQKLVKQHPSVFKYLARHDFHFYDLSEYFVGGKNLGENFTKAVKNYFLNMDDELIVKEDGSYDIPEWLSSMNFVVIDKIITREDLINCNLSTIVLDEKQRRVIDMLNIDNIKIFERETGFFSHSQYEYSSDLEMFKAFVSYFYSNHERLFRQINFQNGALSYEDFLNEFAKCLDVMRKNNLFTDIPNYDWMNGEFRDKHPEIFIDVDAPEELKFAFYNNRITPKFIFNHKDYISYLVDKNLSNTINANIKLNTTGLVNQNGYGLVSSTNFIDEYVSRYGNEKFLELLAKYGTILSDIEIASFNNEIEDENAIEKSLRISIYNKILKEKIDYSYLENNTIFVSEYPDIFVNFDSLTNINEAERLKLKIDFYNRNLTFDDIKLYPELITILKHKNLKIAFGNSVTSTLRRLFTTPSPTDLTLLDVYGNERFLELCSKYGKYMNNIINSILKELSILDGKFIKIENSEKREVTYEEITQLIEDIIARECMQGLKHYTMEDAPNFLKEKYPQLFLEQDAPKELKEYFYGKNSSQSLTFEVLKNHKEWLPYLKGKQISSSLIRQTHFKSDMSKFFKLFGEEKAMKLGINRAETVEQMLRSHQVDLMKSWYDKTGQKFIPDFVVMQNFSLEEADKFLTSGSNWSNLMRIKNFSNIPEAREAMLKLAYSFGAFDQDQRGYKKLLELLTGLPKKIDADKSNTLALISLSIDEMTKRRFYFNINNMDVIRAKASGQKEYINMNLSAEQKEEAYYWMINHLKSNQTIIDEEVRQRTINLIESIKKEIPDFNFATENILNQIYKENEDGSYTLVVNPQSCPKTCEALVTVFQSFESMPVLTPDKAHKLFGGFSLKYDPEFREFLLSNIEEIYEHPEYSTYIASIQKQFSEIKAINSNRVFTLELAISYVQSNKYEGVEVGNERAAEISAIAGYTQTDFNVLQQIYNYGKQRTFSSIPRIEKTYGKYTYEILRLDDPLAMAIGTLTDCCQELGNAAEVCMEHSMVDKNGRVFVIKDEDGNIVAQSWVWRNKDVLCFDNIEIPDKAFSRAIKEDSILGRNSLAYDVFNIYKQAARELIEADEAIYKQLFESGQITKEQYEGLRLGKITVGLGYNDIAAVLKDNSINDRGIITRPLHFMPPVQLSRGLYTNDSNTQHILEERENREVYDGSTLAVHSDTYIEYSDLNFSEKLLLTLEKLELITNEDSRSLKTDVREYAEEGHFVSEISINYNLNAENTRIVMNPNFAIIYDIVGDKIRIGDLLFNTKIENENQKIDIENKVVMQIRLALQQIVKDKQIDISHLDGKKKEMYDKAMGLTDEIDIERGINYAR